MIIFFIDIFFFISRFSLFRFVATLFRCCFHLFHLFDFFFAAYASFIASRCAFMMLMFSDVFFL